MAESLTGGTRTANQDRRLASALVGIAGAIGAFGGVLVQLAFRESFLTYGDGSAAYVAFTVFYLICAAVTWAVYLRPSAGRLAAVRVMRGGAAAPAGVSCAAVTSVSVRPVATSVRTRSRPPAAFRARPPVCVASIQRPTPAPSEAKSRLRSSHRRDAASQLRKAVSSRSSH